MDYEIAVTLMGLTVAGLSAVLGVWVQRDPLKPPRYAYAISVLILLATSVSMFQAWNEHRDNERIKEDLARVLQAIDKIANTGDGEHPELNDFVKTEIAAQSRANPKVVAKFAQRVAADGEDPGEVLGTYLPASDVETVKSKMNFKAPTATAAAGSDPGANGAAKSNRRSRIRVRMGAAAPTPTQTAAAPSPSHDAEPAKAAQEPAEPAKTVAPAESAAPAVKPVAVHARTPAASPAAKGKPAIKIGK